MSGGRSNRSWCLKTEEGSWVFKLFDSGRSNRLFPNDPTAESAALQALVGTGLAPDFQTSFTTGAGICIVYRYVVGAPLRCTDAETIRTLARLHQVRVPKLRRLASTPKALLQQGRKILAGLRGEGVKELDRCAPEPRDIPAGPSVFLHGDPVPANVLAYGEKRMLIDWQCPAIGDATADLAIALSPAMHVVYGAGALTPADELTALQAYPDAFVIRRYLALKPFYHWRMAAYCAWKVEQGEAVYARAFEAELSRI
ncbi:phosphotransferase [Celeribacter sp.]|uniref:phosphotransferase n=1 Tax=Celeribacter sp. TaxID=1890673 RepID=UPI003A8F553C